MLANAAAAAPSRARGPRLQRSFEAEKPLRQDIAGGRLLAALRDFETLAAAGVTPSPQADYLAGWAEWKLHWPERAESLLRSAAQQGFAPRGNRPRPERLLSKIEEFNRSKPPAAEVAGLDRTLLDAYAEARTERTEPILDALPRIVEIGRSIFGEPPPARFFLFATTAAHERFAASINLEPRPNPRSTGIVNMVIVCEEKARRKTEGETLAIALHESTHAWLQGYIRGKYDREGRLPTYIDEGLAVYVSDLWENRNASQDPVLVQRWQRRGARSPDFDSLKRYREFHDHERNMLDYLLAAMLMRRLLGPPQQGARRIPSLLDAFVRLGDDEAAWKELTGKDVRAEYQSMVEELRR